MKGTKLFSILKGKCPVCHKGDLYTTKNPYALNTTLRMYERCPHCDTKFKIEPSFFYGSMYVSYAVGVALAIATFIIAFFVFDTGRLNTFLVIAGVQIVLLPIILRLSRNIWINLFFKYDKEKAI